MRFDEFAIDARHIDLPQINGGARVCAQPLHDGEQARPIVGQLKTRQGSSPQP